MFASLPCKCDVRIFAAELQVFGISTVRQRPDGYWMQFFLSRRVITITRRVIRRRPRPLGTKRRRE
jgi:hypothetical protein